MTEIPNLAAQNLYGIYEMNDSGVVLYYKALADERQLKESAPSLVGLNFFDDIACFENVREFRQRFKHFINNSYPVDNFSFDFQLAEQILEIKVKLVRVSERYESQNSNLIIVDIRKGD